MLNYDEFSIHVYPWEGWIQTDTLKDCYEYTVTEIEAATEARTLSKFQRNPVYQHCRFRLYVYFIYLLLNFPLLAILFALGVKHLAFHSYSQVLRNIKNTIFRATGNDEGHAHPMSVYIWLVVLSFILMIRVVQGLSLFRCHEGATRRGYLGILGATKIARTTQWAVGRPVD